MRRAGMYPTTPQAFATRALCAMALALGVAVPGIAQEPARIVGMVVTSGQDAERAGRVLRSLESLDAEILSATAPSNAELRAMMRRFAQEAAQADAALVFLDMPAVRFEERVFVLPDHARLTRSTDIFTEAVPLRAFARMTVLADRGGAVILSAQEPERDLQDDMLRPDAAPAPLIGSSEILVVPALDADGVLEVLEDEIKGAANVDLRTVLEAMAAAPGASLSGVPASAIVLRAPAVIDLPPAEPVPDIVEDTDTDTPATEAELAILEQSLSPPVKRDLQRRLRALGHYSGLIDGIIGVQTRQAITDFQTTQSVPQTGLLTPAQIVKLLTPE